MATGTITVTMKSVSPSFFGFNFKHHLIVHHTLVSCHGSGLAFEKWKEKFNVGTLRIESFQQGARESRHIAHGKTIPVCIENFDEATHMSAFVVVWQINREGHGGYGSLLLSALILHHQRKLQGLHPYAIDRDLAVIVFVLGIFEFAHLFALNQKTCPK